MSTPKCMLTRCCPVRYPLGMNKRREILHVKLLPAGREKAAFRAAAALHGLTLSVWVRERLRAAARQELEAHGRRVPFVEAR